MNIHASSQTANMDTTLVCVGIFPVSFSFVFDVVPDSIIVHSSPNRYSSMRNRCPVYLCIHLFRARTQPRLITLCGYLWLRIAMAGGEPSCAFHPS
jgi:hypothetical protein